MQVGTVTGKERKGKETGMMTMMQMQMQMKMKRTSFEACVATKVSTKASERVITGGVKAEDGLRLPCSLRCRPPPRHLKHCE